jgi:1-acyl-sn-glycerol-3-phosphate acyltransferase
MKINGYGIKPISESSKRIYNRAARFLAGIFTLDNRFEFKGLENKFKGRKIIVAPHLGKQKDIATTIITYHDEQLFYVANEKVFSEEGLDYLVNKNLRKWFGFLGPWKENLIIALTPVRYAFVKYISSRIKDVGMIPVNVEGKGNGDYKKLAEQYLLEDRPLVFHQHNSKHTPSKYHPELEGFKMGAPKLAYDMLVKYGLDVPLVPISIKGSKGLFVPFRKIKVNIGKPLYISHYASNPEYTGSKNAVVAMKEDLEQTVARLYDEF